MTNLSSRVLMETFVIFILWVTCTAGKNSGEGFVVPPKGRIGVFNFKNDFETEILEIETQASAFRMGCAVHKELKGFLVKSDPPGNGCKRNSRAPKETGGEKIFGRILIVSSSGCSQEEKARNANDAGFNAVIVYNNDGNETELMGIDGSDLVELPIPAYSVGFYYGVQLRDNFTQEFGFFVKIFTPLSVYQIILMGVIWTGLVSIILMFLAAVLKPCIPRLIVPLLRKFQNYMKRISLKRSVNEIPLTEWGTGGKQGQGHHETCAICLEDFREGDKLRVLRCSHGFHKPCVDPWLLEAGRFCPICKDKFEYSTTWGELPEIDPGDYEVEEDHFVAPESVEP